MKWFDPDAVATLNAAPVELRNQFLNDWVASAMDPNKIAPEDFAFRMKAVESVVDHLHQQIPDPGIQAATGLAMGFTALRILVEELRVDGVLVDESFIRLFVNTLFVGVFADPSTDPEPVTQPLAVTPEG